jgi:hypothetical protein
MDRVWDKIRPKREQNPRVNANKAGATLQAN